MNLFSHKILYPFRDSVVKYNDLPAFFINGIFYTYKRFAERVSTICCAINILNLEDKICGLVINDNIETYASIFALWMEGKAYVPLHPNQPIERNQNIIEQVGINYVLDSSEDSAFNNWAEENDKHIVVTSNLMDTADCLKDVKDVGDDELAYILFTSGSTGIPKGVKITRNNVAAFLDSFWKTGIKIDENDRCLQLFDLTFDVSVQNFLVALTRGACVYTVPYGRVKYLYAAQLIQEHHITFGAMAPSMLTYLRPYFDEFDASSMKTCILTAEACPLDLMEDWYKCATNTEIYDFYGPTESTVYCTFYKLTRGGENLSLNGVVSIGKPLANVRAIIIDDDGNIITDEKKGELCVAGEQLTPGYWNNEEKNSSSFFVKEIDGQKLRFYHTGDLCYWEKNNNIMYVGRIDQQAKIQGFRVELGEIEYYAREFFNKGKRVLAIAFQNGDNLTEIALFIESKKVDVSELLVFLRSKMPSYMIPTKILFEEYFPLNKSEKIDRVALKQKIK